MYGRIRQRLWSMMKIRFEDIEGGIRHVCEFLGIPFEPERIPKLKSGIRPTELKLEDYYDKETIEIVSKRCEFEIRQFGYTFAKT